MSAEASRAPSLLERVPRGAWPLLLALGGMILALNLISLAFGEAPRSTLGLALAGTWGTPYGIGQVLFKATPLVFTALAFEAALRAGLFNIGVEGQVALASLVGAALIAKLPAAAPALLAIPLALAVASAAGMAVAALPGWMRARLGVHEIISTIMMNRIVDGLLPWALVSLLGHASLRTDPLPASALMPRFEALFPSLAGSAASLAFPLAVGVAFGFDALMKRTRLGREIRWVGLGSEACLAEGVPVARRLVQAMLISGGLAGMAMAATVLGYKGYYELGLGAGAGFSGIAVAMLGRGRPVGIVLAAVLFGTLEQAGLAINARVPKDAVDVLEALVIVLVAAANRSVLTGRAARGGAP